MSEDVKKQYKQRLKRVMDTIQLKEPDRVPNMTVMQAFPCYYSGITIQDAMNDYSKAALAYDTFFRDFKPDLGWDPVMMYSAHVMKAPGFQLLQWPGNGIADPNQMYQFIEKEYMKADEYDELIFDPTHFMQSKYIPRIFSELQGLKHLSLRNSTWIGFLNSFLPFGLEEVQNSFKALFKTGEAILKWNEFLGEYEKKMENEFGIPTAWGAFGFAPYDMLGDSLRGTVELMEDLYDRPEKVLQAVEVFLPLILEASIEGCKATGRPFVWIWLHKGIDSFMSDAHYRKFYWPTLQKYVIGLIDAGLIPVLYVEGAYNSRLEVLTDLPKGKVIFDFEEIDMAKAKKILGNVGCIAGNVSNSLLAFGTEKEVEESCKRLIDTCAPGGGFIMDTSALVDNAKPENMKALFRVTQEYGTYR